MKTILILIGLSTVLAKAQIDVIVAELKNADFEEIWMCSNPDFSNELSISREGLSKLAPVHADFFRKGLRSGSISSVEMKRAVVNGENWFLFTKSNKLKPFALRLRLDNVSSRMDVVPFDIIIGKVDDSGFIILDQLIIVGFREDSSGVNSVRKVFSFSGFDSKEFFSLPFSMPPQALPGYKSPGTVR